MKCSDCELTTNLWFCLECGEFHCGRKQWDANGLPGRNVGNGTRMVVNILCDGDGDNNNDDNDNDNNNNNNNNNDK